jgi:hypothetical protein
MATKNARKTVEVGALLHRLNYFLASDKSTATEREVMCTFVEGILFDTGNYEGFRYLPNDHCELDFETDGTRRYYFVNSKIRADYDAAAELIEKHYYGRGV